MSDNIRIKTTPGGDDKSVNINISQKFDFIEILSLKISQTEAYKRFCSDYGVVVGRVIINNGVGAPNAKVSIFIPVTEVDLEDPEISGLYPYELTTDVDSEGIPYNLVPRNNRGKDECFTPVGTFPSKREIQDNPEMGDIYCKYYKFTTTTNDSGDYMLFGVPVGSHIIHVDADISDIGIYSQRPYDAIRDGEDSKKFNSSTKFKNREETSVVKQLKTFTPTSVYVPPFWGDTEQCSIGIARSDINLGITIKPHAIFMGSVISDNDKNALNRTCVPRKQLGKMQEVVTGGGTIEMIRKTFDGNTERFDVEGGQVIDNDGVWAYQIPMNRDFMVTSENGTFVPSDDPTKGIPTKAMVRFRIGMNINGDEGNLRTRAKYLVPHNPATWADADFSFDTSTKNANFRELSWNKIYTVKNHITRVQARGGADNRNFIGIKNVDDAGSKNPFPFNKLDNDINPLFTILCVIMAIIARIVGIINLLIIPLINVLIRTLNGVLLVVCEAIFGLGKLVCGLKYAALVGGTASERKSCRRKYCLPYKDDNTKCPGDCDNCTCKDILKYIPYITLKCSAETSGKEYAPNALYGTPGLVIRSPYHLSWLATSNGEDALGNSTTLDFHYLGGVAGSTADVDEAQHACGPLTYNGIPIPPLHQQATLEGCDAGWTNCMAAALADALDVFKFDFYNDWINGALYPFLLKHKIKKQGAGRERFCEVDCDDFTGGVNNDNKRGSDNPCKSNKIVDTCVGAEPKVYHSGLLSLPIFDAGVNTDVRYDPIRSGYIKKFDGVLYYTPIAITGDHKLFATDIVNLGSVFDCDWEGQPRFYQYLPDTTFNIPPLIGESERIGSTDVVTTTGFDTIVGGNASRLIGNIRCLGLDTDTNTCNNLKRFSELGMGLDELRIVPTSSGGEITISPDNKIGNEDVEQDYVRGIFTHLNTPGSTTINSVMIDRQPGGPKVGYPDYQDPHYTEFRVAGGIKPSNGAFWNKDIWVYDNSYYFYFGLNKGNTALGKMKRKYFTECAPEADIDFFVVATRIQPDAPGPGREGEIDITPSGGVGPYTYFWTGPTIANAAGTPISYPITNTTKDISGLYAGIYTVRVLDSVGNTTSGVFVIPGPPSISCNIQNTNVLINGQSTGDITVGIVTATSPPYSIEIFDYTVSTSGGVPTLPAITSVSTSLLSYPTFTGYPAGNYQVVVKDSGLPQTTCQQIIFISEPTALNVTLTPIDVSCNGGTNGRVSAAVSGGDAPYTYLWSNGATTNTITGLVLGLYSVTVTDINGQVATPIGANVYEPSVLTYATVSAPVVCNGTKGIIHVTGVNGGTANSAGTYKVNVKDGSAGVNIELPTDTNGDVTFTNLEDGAGGDKYTIVITDDKGCTISATQEVFVPDVALNISLVGDGKTLAVDGVNETFIVTINGGVFETDSTKPWGLQKYRVQWKVTNNASGVVINTQNNDILTGTDTLSFKVPLGSTVEVNVIDKTGTGCNKLETKIT